MNYTSFLAEAISLELILNDLNDPRYNQVFDLQIASTDVIVPARAEAIQRMLELAARHGLPLELVAKRADLEHCFVLWFCKSDVRLKDNDPSWVTITEWVAENDLS